jgi:hypothetical protein
MQQINLPKLEVNNNNITSNYVKKIVEHTGRRVGGGVNILPPKK